MLGIAAFIFFTLSFILGGSDAHTNAWFGPPQLMYAGLACLALHLSGASWTRKP